MPKTSYFEIEIDDIPFVVKKIVENRRGARFAFGKDAIIFRLPTGLLPRQKKETEQWFVETLTQKIRKNPDLKHFYQIRTYESGNQLEVGTRKYQLQINYTDRKTHKASLKNGIIQLELAEGEPPFQLQKSIKTLLSRVVGKDFHPTISRRVHELNELYFKKTIHSVKLKYNQSNWGSCSSKGNINLSTRLLFAPDDVVDYVIIHELAHLVEMNHSPRFWKLVAEAMPDYHQKEQWLKANRWQYDF